MTDTTHGEGWEEEFDIKFGEYTLGTNGEAKDFDSFTLYELVQDFIRATIAKERAEALQAGKDAAVAYVKQQIGLVDGVENNVFHKNWVLAWDKILEAARTTTNSEEETNQ